MATLVHQCPHCVTERIALTIVTVTYGPPTRAGESVANYVHMSCAGCGKPSCAEVASRPNGQLIGIEAMPYSLATMGWAVRNLWPDPPRPRLPDYLPDAVAKAFLSAERNFPQNGMEEASAGSYGRALDVATKLFAPEFAGLALFARIKKLAETMRITPELAAWAHAIRFIRNDALHEIDSITRDELVAIRGFSEMVLTYLFTLPGMLRERQSVTDERPKD